MRSGASVACFVGLLGCPGSPDELAPDEPHAAGFLGAAGEGGVIDIADLDTDGANELVVASGDADEVHVFWAPQEACPSTCRSSTGAGTAPRTSRCCWRTETSWSFWENDGAGGFTPGPETAVGGAPGSAVVLDADGDGDIDLVVTNYRDDTVSVLLSRNSDGT
ncbi:MAG: VCBS repeat-containing protein [Deltaproteobacteria bacterium]|nr:VCBS repeat-containing protein [Deltaproteobacteria bacterium]